MATDDPDDDALALSTPGEREITLTRAFAAPRERVFDAFTQPDLVKRWMGARGWPMVSCAIDLRVGGRLRYVWRNAEGAEMGVTGTFSEITPAERIVHTELFDEDWTGGETRVTTCFTENEGRTTVAMTIRYATQTARDAVLESPMERGLAETYDNLARLLGT